MRIRPYRPEAAPALSALYYESVHGLGALRYSPAQVAAWTPAPADPAATNSRARDGRLTVVAEGQAGRVVGFGDINADGHVDRLYRSPAPNACGVGAVLLDRLLAHAAEQGMARLTVEASEMARGLFERRGFHVVERRDFERNGVMIRHYAMALALDREAKAGPGLQA